MRSFALVLVLFLIGCAETQPLVYTYRYNYDLPGRIKILSSDLKITETGSDIKVEHRIYYSLVSEKDYTEVIINRKLKDLSGRTLAQKNYKDVQRSGVYPNTFEFRVPNKNLPKGWFLIETNLTSHLDTVTDKKYFSFNEAKRAYSYNGRGADIYKYLFSAESCPEGLIPVAYEINNPTDKRLLNQWIECATREELQGKVISINEDFEKDGIYYPRTGKRYPIPRSKYPEFYDRLDPDRDGKITMYELGRIQRVLSEITTRYQEGDIDSIVREFLRVRFR